MSLTYLKKETAVHNLNPFVKLVLVLTYLILGSLYTNPIYLLFILFNIFYIAYISDCLSEVLKFLRFFVLMAVFVFIFNFLLNRNGETILFIIPIQSEWFGDLIFTLETLVYAAIFVLKLIIIILSFTLMNFLINPDDLLRALMKLKLPYSFSLLITMSLRFFPLMIQDIEIVSDVQKARGLELDTGNFITRIKNKIGLILPLLANSLDRAVQVAEAMESKGFARKNVRTFYREISLSKKDIFNLLFQLAILIVVFYTFTVGFGLYEIYPIVKAPNITDQDFLIIIFLIFSHIFLYSLINRKEDAQ